MNICAYSPCFVCFSVSVATATDISERFILTPNPMNWLSAQTFCRTTYTDLARVRNQQENDLLQATAAGQQVWLGLQRMFWRWSDGSEPSFIPWDLSALLSGDLFDVGAVEISTNPLGLVQRHYTDLQPFICYSGNHLFFLFICKSILTAIKHLMCWMKFTCDVLAT